MNSIAKQIIQDSVTYTAFLSALTLQPSVEESNELFERYHFDDGSFVEIFDKNAVFAYVSDENLGRVLTVQKTFTI
jgi:hypothetical protein